MVGALVLLTVPGAALASLVNDIVARDLLGPRTARWPGTSSRTAEFVSGSRTFPWSTWRFTAW